jgi:NADH-quinone oxidoreductase subunit I
MQALTNRVKVLEQKPMTIMERLYLPAIAKGMIITFSHIFKKKATINYPEEKRPGAGWAEPGPAVRLRWLRD